MSLIAGFVHENTGRDARATCSSMLATLRPWGCEQSDIIDLHNASFGRNLWKLLPEDDFDTQPLTLAGGSMLLVADTRLDNRVELAAELGLEGRQVRSWSDTTLLGIAWEKWGPAIFHRVVGDFALAIWDRRKDELILARSPMSLKPLFYHAGSRFHAFASLPAGLHAFLPKSPDLDYASAVASLLPSSGCSTIFAGVKMVQHGHLVRLRTGYESHERIWNLQREIVHYARPSDYGDRLREELDRAVEARLRRHHGIVASQLSSGRDSSAVTSSAATTLGARGERLLALTAAPRIGFNEADVKGRLSDESLLASRTASEYSNIDHQICRTRPVSFAGQMTALHQMHHGPLLNPSNMNWWERMGEAAQKRKATVMLNGAFGNYGLSAGGASHLRDLLRESGIFAWARAALGGARLSPAKWRNALSITLGPSLTRGVYSALLTATGRTSGEGFTLKTLRHPYGEAMVPRLAECIDDPRPPASYFDFRREMIFSHQDAELMTLRRWGLDVRDPTADRRVIEYCFSLPADQLVSASSQRPAFECAFSSRIPREVLASATRGYQTADWYEIFPADQVRDAFHFHSRNAVVRELIDLEYIDRLIEDWPQEAWNESPTIYKYRNAVLGTLALVNFLDAHFSN